MTTPCGASTPIRRWSTTISKAHREPTIDATDDTGRDHHVCGRELNPDGTTHIGMHNCRYCGVDYNVPVWPQDHAQDITVGGGEGSTRNDTSPETPRPVAISLPGPEDSSVGRQSDEFSRLLKTGPSGLPVDFFPGHRRLSAVDIALGRTYPAGTRPVDLPFPERRHDWDNELGGFRSLEPSLVDRHMVRADALLDLWQRTFDLLGKVSADLAVQADRLVRYDDNVEGVVVDIAAVMVDLGKARMNLERLRPTPDQADVMHALTRMESTVARLASVVHGNTAAVKDLGPTGVSDARARMVDPSGLRIITDHVADHRCDARRGVLDLACVRAYEVAVDAPKPASYMVPGLVPHRFRNDGSDPNENACTWRAQDGPYADKVCGYGPNAQVHRRMMQPGKNAAPAPADTPSTQENRPFCRVVGGPCPGNDRGVICSASCRPEVAGEPGPAPQGDAS